MVLNLCLNKEHPKAFHQVGYCKRCGVSECSPNYAYHICVSKELRK